MPRNPTAPRLPDSPATWLANFRYRLAGENGERLSPESLGFRLGVSGATVRRWEAGQSNPSDDDLVRFADVCRLSAQQREFIHRLFARGSLRATGEPANFRREATAVLSIPECACLVDELFYIRAWNGTFAASIGPLASRLPQGLNAVHLSLALGRRTEAALEEQRVRSIVRQMWMWTAHLAVYPAYSALVNELLDHEAFAANWLATLEEGGSDLAPPLVMPVLQSKTEEGGYTVHAGEVLFPPLYRVFICLPEILNEGAPAAETAPVVYFADRLHWSE